MWRSRPRKPTPDPRFTRTRTGYFPWVNLLQERAMARTAPPWLDIYDTDLEAAQAAWEVWPDDETPPTRRQGA